MPGNDTTLISSDEKKSQLARILLKKSSSNKAFFPLSYGQEALWYIYQMDPENPAYNTHFVGRTTDRINTTLLEETLQILLERHPMLRTTYTVREGEPVQKINDNKKIYFEIIDATMLNETELQDTLKKESCRPFNLEKGPLMRVYLYHTSANDYILLIVIHHISVDYWSMAILLDELGQIYQTLSKEENVSMIKTKKTYNDFIHDQRRLISNSQSDKLLNYWRDQLSGELPILNLFHKKDSYTEVGNKSKPFSVKKDLKKKIRIFAKQNNTTVYTVLLGAFQILLSKYTGQKDILLGTPTAGRNKSDFDNIVGYFVNPIVLRSDTSENPTFINFLKQLREKVIAGIDNQEYPFPLLVENIQPQRGKRSPIFQAMFAFQKAPRLEEQDITSFILGNPEVKLNLGGINFKNYDLPQQEGQFEMTLHIDSNLFGAIQFNKTLFEENMIDRLIEHYQVLLEEIVAHPEYRLAEFSILTNVERHQLLDDWNNTYEDIPEDNVIHHLFEKQAAKQGDHLAVILDEITLSYQELNQRANQVAYYLQSQGIGPETRVGVCMERSADLIICLLGVLKAGGAYVPIEPNMPTDRIAYILEDSNTSILLTGKWGEEYISSGNWKRVLYDPAIFQQYPETNIMSKVNQNNTAYIIYTSGSTGTPKGVIEAHRPVINLIDWVTKKYQVGTTDRVLWITSIGFDLSVYDIFGLLAVGGSIRIASQEDIGNPERLIHLLDKEKITFWDSAPAALQQLAPLLKIKENPLENTKLRLIFLSGDWIPLDLPKVMKQYVPEVEVIGLGGATEATIWSNYYEINDIPEEWTSIPYGKPIQNARYYVLDQNKNLCPVGIPGELYIAGECLAEGYVNQTLTKERFLPDPFAGEGKEKMYHTGDLARYWEDGNIEFLGRIDHQVKIRGYRIELGEIETIINQHPNIENSVVTLWEESNRLTAYIVLVKKKENTIQEITKILREKLPEYMMPSAFIILNEIPITSNGKVDRKGLPKPDSVLDVEKNYAAPRTKTEEILVEIWKELLDASKIGVKDNFFEIGGHSLLLTQVHSKIIQYFKIELPIQSTFNNLDIENLARVIEDEILKEIEDLSDEEVYEKLKEYDEV